MLLSAFLSLFGCPAEQTAVLDPIIVLRLSLPPELPPAAAPCLDLVLSSPTAPLTRTFVGFGASPLIVKVQTLDVDGDSRDDLRIRFIEGSTPFLSSRTDMIFTPGVGANRETALAVTATARLADGTTDANDRCLGGTALAQGTAAQDTGGQPIRFPSRGRTIAEVPMACVRSGGCALPAPDAGTPPPDGGSDGGASEDGGGAFPDGGAADGG
jgi:hypothetical protein